MFCSNPFDKPNIPQFLCRTLRDGIVNVSQRRWHANRPRAVRTTTTGVRFARGESNGFSVHRSVAAANERAKTDIQTRKQVTVVRTVRYYAPCARVHHVLLYSHDNPIIIRPRIAQIWSHRVHNNTVLHPVLYTWTFACQRISLQIYAVYSV